MNNREELKNLVELVKRNSKRAGNQLTQEEIAEKFGIGRPYLSQLLSGAKIVLDEHIKDFKLKLRDYLITITPEMALLNVLLEDYADYKSRHIKEKVSKEEIINDLKNKASSLLDD